MTAQRSFATQLCRTYTSTFQGYGQFEFIYKGSNDKKQRLPFFIYCSRFVSSTATNFDSMGHMAGGIVFLCEKVSDCQADSQQFLIKEITNSSNTIVAAVEAIQNLCFNDDP